MNYELLTILVSIILLLVAYMQYFNNKNNFLTEKLPIINIKNIGGIYNKEKIKFTIDLENVGNSPAVDVILEYRISEMNNLNYSKVNFLKDSNNIIIKIEFDKNEIEKFINIMNNNKRLFKEKITNQILLPVLSIGIYYKNIFNKCYKLSYDRGMYQFNEFNIDKKKLKIINFISENAITFSLKKVSKYKFKKILKKYNNNLPFEKVYDNELNKKFHLNY